LNPVCASPNQIAQHTATGKDCTRCLLECFHFCARCEKRNGRMVGCQSLSSLPPALPSATAFSSPQTNSETRFGMSHAMSRRDGVEMLKIVPGLTACRLEIQLSENGDGCFADITYSHTSMSSAGDEFVTTFTADYYQRFMRAWETELNYFLKTGSRLTDGSAA